MRIPVHQVQWRPCWRLISTRYKEELVLLKIAEPEDLKILGALDEMTNDRLRQEREEISIVPPEDRVSGPGSQLIMAPFCDKNPEGSRFSDGSYGVFYAAHAVDTAVEESKHHTKVFMSRTQEGPMRLERKALRVHLSGKLHDLRGQEKKFPAVYARDKYAASQTLGRSLKEEGSFGIAYDSVRQREGECVAVFRPAVLSDCRVHSDWIFEWNGAELEKVYVLREH